MYILFEYTVSLITYLRQNLFGTELEYTIYYVGCWWWSWRSCWPWWWWSRWSCGDCGGLGGVGGALCGLGGPGGLGGPVLVVSAV